AVAEFWGSALEALFPPLQNLLPVLSPVEAATAYRALRQLPPYLVTPRPDSPGWQVLEQLALRCLALATVEAFDFELLTSLVYSQLCLYPELWADEGGDGTSLTNPAWTTFLQSWEATSMAWKATERPTQLQPETAKQSAALQLLWGSESPGAARQVENRNRPVALELQEHIRASLPKAVVEGPHWEGPFEIHAAVGGTAFCLMPEDAYFKISTRAPFSEEDPDGDQDALELCHERRAQVHLLRARGWRVCTLAFHSWRRLGHAQRQ
ncbi:acbC, partial [Symbiodinium pilosum]